MSQFEKMSSLAALATALLDKLEDVRVIPNSRCEAEVALGLAVLLEQLLHDYAQEAAKLL